MINIQIITTIYQCANFNKPFSDGLSRKINIKTKKGR